VTIYVIARILRSRTPRDNPAGLGSQAHYLVQSAGSSVADHLNSPRNELVVTRYYFRKTDTTTGPADPADFYDELFIDLADPNSDQTWQNSIHVATPRALDRVMVEEQWDSVIGTELLIVRRYDLRAIMRGAVDHLQELYEARVQLTGKTPQPPAAG
jgi:hypothetical protein